MPRKFTRSYCLHSFWRTRLPGPYACRTPQIRVRFNEARAILLLKQAPSVPFRGLGCFDLARRGSEPEVRDKHRIDMEGRRNAQVKVRVREQGGSCYVYLMTWSSISSKAVVPFVRGALRVSTLARMNSLQRLLSFGSLWRAYRNKNGIVESGKDAQGCCE